MATDRELDEIKQRNSEGVSEPWNLTPSESMSVLRSMFGEERIPEGFRTIEHPPADRKEMMEFFSHTVAVVRADEDDLQIMANAKRDVRILLEHISYLEQILKDSQEEKGEIGTWNEAVKCAADKAVACVNPGYDILRNLLREEILKLKR